MNERVCFIISTIGSENSEERLSANKFLELTKEIGEIHHLKVIRADEVSGTSDINMDIIDMIQNSDLCIIDLTGLNPNVMYEFGMRYQTGLPYIVCAKRGTKLPFDIISRRTIFYGDLEKTNDYREAKKSIRDFINQYEERDYQASSSVSINDLYQMIQLVIEKVERIEKINTQSYSATVSNNSVGKILDNGDVDELLRQLDPAEAFHYAYTTNQIRLAEQLLDYCRDQPIEHFTNKLCALATLGSKKAIDELSKYYKENISDISINTMKEVLGSIVSGFNHQDSECENLNQMEELFGITERRLNTNKDEAFFHNQKTRFYTGANELDLAKENAEKAIQLDDTEPAYIYNYVIVLTKLGDKEGSLENAKKLLSFEGSVDADHLSLICRILKESSFPADGELYNECLNRLEKISPYKARLIRLL